MKKILLLFIALSVVLSGCVSVLVTPTVGNPTEVVVTPLLTKEPTSTEVSTPMPNLPPTPEIPTEHSPVTLEDVKNVKYSSEILINEEGVITGLPEGVPEEEKSLVVGYYEAIQKKFLGSKVFYNKDEKTGKWLLFVRLEENLFHRTLSVDGGTSRFADYPLKFEPSASGTGYKVADFYNVITLQNESVDVIWKEGVPQIVCDEVELLPDGVRYFTKYLIYDVDVNSTESNLWAEVPGVLEIIASAPTPIPSDIEKDLNPSYTQSTDWEYMGVRIKADLIVDSSLNPLVTKITIPDAVFAEFIARTVFKVWWYMGSEEHLGVYTEEDFNNFIVLWSTAQKSGKIEDWEKVQLNNIFANDLTDGNGYVPKSYNIWPMYEGNKPLRAVGVGKISFVNVDTSSVQNLDRQSDINGISYDIGYGTNLDGNNLLIYRGTDSFQTTKAYNYEHIVDAGLAVFGDWLIENKGKGKSTTFYFNELTGWLYDRGLQVYP